MKNRLLALALLATLALPVSSLSSSSTPAGAEHIAAEQMKGYLSFIASDELEGRDTPSRGLDISAKFLAAILSTKGLKPGGDNGTYFQQMTLTRSKIDPSKSSAEFNGKQYAFGEDFLTGIASGTATGSMVFVSHGWVIKSKNINAYSGVDVKDKILVTTGRALPKGVTLNDLKGKKGEDWEDITEYASRNGARGIVQISQIQKYPTWWKGRRADQERGFMAVEKFQKQNNLPSIMPSAQFLKELFTNEKFTSDELYTKAQSGEALAAFDLKPEKKISFTVSTSVQTSKTQNVVAILEGSDPVLKREYVAIGAHYDHVGTDANRKGDNIYNGADDDGSGTVAVLQMAEAFASSPRPKRSILFVWHCGEEKGLWGSRYFTENPTVPIGDIVAHLNIDMIGRSRSQNDTKPENRELTGPNEIYLIGPKIMSKELGDIAERVNRSFLNLSLNHRFDDTTDPSRFFYRSDHYNYAIKGIPIIFFFSGVHEDYHQPSDTHDKIDYQKLEKVTRTIYATAREIANALKRPQIDKGFAPEADED
jgi:hypothetical protein